MHGAQVQALAGHLRADRKRDALVGLDVDDEDVRLEPLATAAFANGGCGARLNWIAIVVSRFGSRLPTRT